MLPGYKHVSKFGPDEEYEGDEEVCYVTLDLGSNVDKSLLPNTSEYRLAGLDTATPMLQLSGTFFKGRHEELIGTELLFTDGRDESNPSKRLVVPVGTTEQRIKFEQVNVQPKWPESKETVNDSGGSTTTVRQRPIPRSRGRGKKSRKGKEPEDTLTQPGEQVLDFENSNHGDGS